MSRLSLIVVAGVLFAVLVSGCSAPTAVPTAVPGVILPTSAPPTGYPAAEPTLTLPATGYPAETPLPTPTPYSYPDSTEAGPVVIVYKNYEIVPATTVVKVGAEVTFQIEGDPHQPYAGDAEPWIFEAPANLENTTWSTTFTVAQTLTILCGYHPNMSATLIVEP